MSTDTGAAAPRIPDSAMPELLELIKGADSVELKLSVPAGAQRATIANLPIDPVEAQPRQVFFFDTPDLQLSQAGVVVRARRIQGGRGDTVVKLRPVVPTQLPSSLRRSAAFNVEVDALPGGFVCSGSMKGRTTNQEISDAVAGKIPLRRIFTKEQRTLFKEKAPAGITFESLVPLGPTFILKAVWVPKPGGRRMVGEVWLYPDGTRILELSTKCLPSETFQVAAEARAALSKRGVPISDVQQTKTRTAMEFFSAELAAKTASEATEPPAADASAPEPKPAAVEPASKPARSKPAPTKAASTKPAPTKPAPTKAAATKAAATKAAATKVPPTKATATRRVRTSGTGTPTPRRGSPSTPD